MEKENGISILTEPPSLYWFGRTMVKKILRKDNGSGGHPAVTRNLIEGLKKIDYSDFNYREWRKDRMYENVHVLAGVQTLRAAIRLKEQGRILQLSAGPNIVVFSSDHDSIIADERIDFFLCNSEWIKNQYIEMEPRLKGRLKVWPTGIDANRFKPTANMRRNQVLIYHKDESD